MPKWLLVLLGVALVVIGWPVWSFVLQAGAVGGAALAYAVTQPAFWGYLLAGVLVLLCCLYIADRMRHTDDNPSRTYTPEPSRKRELSPEEQMLLSRLLDPVDPKTTREQEATAAAAQAKRQYAERLVREAERREEPPIDPKAAREQKIAAAIAQTKRQYAERRAREAERLEEPPPKPSDDPQ